mmetsp:Transcript_8621/g.13970  ORF Transcript_8621/g.13970 Transcript_8621/m.13970 type:complete len:345 (-) Transcript_8621:103-1137(-)
MGSPWCKRAYNLNIPEMVGVMTLLELSSTSRSSYFIFPYGDRTPDEATCCFCSFCCFLLPPSRLLFFKSSSPCSSTLQLSLASSSPSTFPSIRAVSSLAAAAAASSSSSSSSVPVHSMLDVVVKYLQKIAQKRFPDVAKATHAEWWAHRRPHQSGHQLHYDSDNEGVSDMKDAKVRHPIASTVLYLTEGNVGGPTLVTDQTRSSSAKDVLKTQGVLAYPKRNRVVVFDGKVLHGVIPGHGIVKKGERRVTFMCAFWKGLKTRPASTVPGASQMIPRNSCSFYSWHSQNVAALIPSEMDQTTSNPKPRYPLAVAQVWDTLNAHRQNDNPTTTGTSLTYDSCFQGF